MENKMKMKSLPKSLLNEQGSLFRITCIRCGCEYGCKENVKNLICGVCRNFMERDDLKKNVQKRI